MVSGLVTSPCDQLRIFSGDARLMRIASKSAITFAISKGLERNKVFLRFPALCQYRVPSAECRVPSTEFFCSARFESSQCAKRFFLNLFQPSTVPISRVPSLARYSRLGTQD